MPCLVAQTLPDTALDTSAVDGQWFDEARFGMFVHWGHSSQLGCDLSWPMAGGLQIGGMRSTAVPIDEYHSGADTFCPEPGAAKAWTALAREAGMRYAVLTTKHHDGYAMWPTKLTDWSIARSPYGGDLVGEFVNACRSEGLRVGLYHSLSDWHHPDYPALTDADLPYSLGTHRRSSPEGWQRYLDVLFGQVAELLTDYGPIDVLWFDGQWERLPDEWRATELREHIRSLQPDCLVNERLPGATDFTTPEQFIPPSPPGGRFEVCMTMNDSWGFCPSDTNYKSARSLTHTLIEVAARGGNLLLNVSPGPDGALPREQVERLSMVAGWMAGNAAAIHATTPALEPWQFYGPSTRRGDTTYLFCLARPYETVTVRGVPVRRIASVIHVATGTELTSHARMSVIDELINSDPYGELMIALPDDLIDDQATTIALQIAPS